MTVTTTMFVHPGCQFFRNLAVALVLATSALASPASTHAQETLPLWPNQTDGASGAPGAKGNADGDRPYLVKHLINAETPAPLIVIVPGGGYGGLAAGHEGTEIAQWCNANGISAVICMYRHRNSGAGYGYPYPIMDAQRAIRTARASAKDWNIDPNRVGVIGFSAGGHLVTSLSTTETLEPNASDPIEAQSSRPDFAIVCYPVIAFGREYTHVGSQRNLLGDNVAPERLAELSTDNRVTANTPPTFLWHTAEDKVVPVQNALVYYQALLKHGVPSELHVFEKGRHGLGLALKETTSARHWSETCLTWLREHGFVQGQ